MHWIARNTSVKTNKQNIFGILITWSRKRWQTCQQGSSRWWCSATSFSWGSTGTQWQSNFLKRNNLRHVPSSMHAIHLKNAHNLKGWKCKHVGGPTCFLQKKVVFLLLLSYFFSPVVFVFLTFKMRPLCCLWFFVPFVIVQHFTFKNKGVDL